MYKRTAALLAVAVAALALALPARASAARAVHYGRQDHGRPQGHLRALQGRDDPPISFPVNQNNLKWKDEQANTGFYYNHVTKNYEFSTRKLRNGTIRGTLGQQFQFLVPKYPPGAFVIYGCLGVTHFSAKPAVR